MKNKGGFVGVNSGSIEDCYSRLGLEGRKSGISGFFGENTGTIRQSFHSGKLGHMDNGFGESGQLDNCFYFTGKGEGEKAKKLPDSELWVEDADISDEDKARELGFDENKWNYIGDKKVLEFRGDTWFWALDRLPAYASGGGDAPIRREKIKIENADDLEAFAKRVNDGDEAARNAKVTLEDDLDLGGKSWIPIGIDRSHCFQGVFDGKGHSISNFKVKEKDLDYRGFFGVLAGGAYNLTVDCNVSGGGVMGAFAAELMGGEIRCCGAVTNLRPDKYAQSVGGLVGISSGVIALSYAAGRVRFFPILLLPFLGALGLALIPATAAVIATVLIMAPKDQPVNNPVEPDKTQIAIPDADLPDLPVREADKHTITFNAAKEATADLSTGKVNVLYQSTNPNADQKVVVELQLSTGVVIARTGALLPGNQITEMTLTDRAKSELTPGRYTASLHGIPYSTEDESKSFIELDVPITLTVR